MELCSQVFLLPFEEFLQLVQLGLPVSQIGKVWGVYCMIGQDRVLFLDCIGTGV